MNEHKEIFELLLKHSKIVLIYNQYEVIKSQPNQDEIANLLVKNNKVESYYQNLW